MTKSQTQENPENPLRIGLVIPYFEAGTGLTDALASVHLNDDDLVIVVDDGSTNFPASSIVPEIVGNTPVRLVTLKENLGITGALNAGIQALPSEFELIARLDCGDICTPDRFSKQRQYFESNPELGIVGSWAEFVLPNGKYLYTAKFPESSAAIRRYMRINSAFCHPSVIMRRTSYDSAGGYSRKYPAAEDYALFRSIASKTDSMNIPESLVQCLTGDGGISQRRRTQQLRTRIRVMKEHFDWHPLAAYGILRASVQLLTPRSFTTFLRSQVDTLQNRRSG